MYEKLKSFIADDGIFMVLLLLLVGIVSFGLGRQSVVDKVHKTSESGPSSVVFSQTVTIPTQQVAPTINEATEIKLVASRSGTKYHLPNCPGAKQIKEENKIYFDTVALAAAAGYSPAANCPGL